MAARRRHDVVVPPSIGHITMQPIYDVTTTGVAAAALRKYGFSLHIISSVRNGDDGSTSCSPWFRLAFQQRCTVGLSGTGVSNTQRHCRAHWRQRRLVVPEVGLHSVYLERTLYSTTVIATCISSSSSVPSVRIDDTRR